MPDTASHSLSGARVEEPVDQPDTTPQTLRDGRMFRIGDLAAEFGVTLRTLRFYEDKGLLNPRRNGVTRLYSRRDRARLKLILLGKRLGFSLDEVRKMIELYDPRGKNETQLKVALEKGTGQLQALKRQRDELDTAIFELERTIGVVREMLETPK
jgi:DNA-binding transcriptional MerR regulator